MTERLMTRTRSWLLASLLTAGVAVLAGCEAPEEEPPPPPTPAPRTEAPAPAGYTLPRGLESLEIATPPDNPLTTGRIALGKQLFFDKRLSRNDDMSCETCHIPEKGWADPRPLSPKWDGSMNTRHSPTLYNVAFYPELYWDGRSQGLEAQVLAAWKGNMGAEPEAIAAKLAAIPGYASQFQAEFGGAPTGDGIVKALSGFVRTIHAGDTAWDRHAQDDASLQGSEIGRGFKVFSEVAQCALCHAPPMFSDADFHNVGIGFDTDKPDLGRGGHLAKKAADAGQPAPSEAETLKGAFKTPTLRGIGLSAPYFHDGRAATLDEAVDLMLKGGIANPHLDPKLKPKELTPTQRQELMAFLKALTPENPAYERPQLP